MRKTDAVYMARRFCEAWQQAEAIVIGRKALPHADAAELGKLGAIMYAATDVPQTNQQVADLHDHCDARRNVLAAIRRRRGLAEDQEREFQEVGWLLLWTTGIQCRRAGRPFVVFD